MHKVAPYGALIPGTPQWCASTINLLKRSFQYINSDHEYFEKHLNELRQYKAWEIIPEDDPYGSEEVMLELVLGKKINAIEAELKNAKTQLRSEQTKLVNKKDQLNRRPRGRPPKNVFNNENDEHIYTGRPSSHSAAVAHRRLSRYRPDIHARVLAGEISAHAGMIEAGFRKKLPSQKRTVYRKAYDLIDEMNDRKMIEELILAFKQRLRQLESN